MFDSILDAIEAIKRGDFVVVMDDEDRENEGDLVIAAEHITPEKMAFLIRYTSGIICAPMTQERAAQLELPPMIDNNTDPKKTAFTVSCDIEGTSTGVSAADRALTVNALADPSTKASQFRKPGHIFPLVARSGGVLERRGHTEASVDLCQFAGLKPVGVLAELANKDGTMSRLKECHAFARKHGLVITTVEALAGYKQSLTLKAHSVEVLAECEVPIQRQDKYLGVWTMRCYRSYPDGLSRHIALIKGDIAAATEPVLARIHSECFTSHVVGSRKCDCSQQMDVSLEIIEKAGCGVAIYVDGHEGRGIGLHNKIKAYSLQNSKSLDTYEANQELGFPIDMRKYDTPRAILHQLGLSKIAIISNNPTKIKAFEDMVARVVPAICEPNEHNADYLKAKRIYEKKHLSVTNDPLGLDNYSSSPTPTNTTAQATTKESVDNPTEEAAAGANKYSADPHLSKEIPIHLPSLENISALRIGIIRTSWNETLVGSLHSKCISALLEYGVKPENIVQDFDVPGSFELPFAAQGLARSGRVDTVICFGVLIKGETMHFEYISGAVSQGLMQAQLATGIPVIYGVLNCLTLEQAAVRCGTTGDSILPQSLAATAIRMASMKKGIDVNYAQTKPMLQPCAMG